MKPLILLAPLLLGSTAPQDAFMASLQSLCGKAFAGKVVSNDAADASFAGKSLVMHVRECGADGVRIPLHVGEDRSRTWVITRTETGLRLKHDHRHEDGKPDQTSMYGGETAASGSPTRQEFPVDGESIAMFNANGLTASVTNVWAVEATPAIFAYELRRANRHFRVEFDLTKPVAAPPAPWGSE